MQKHHSSESLSAPQEYGELGYFSTVRMTIIPLGVNIFNAVLQITQPIVMLRPFAPKQVVRIFFLPVILGKFTSELLTSCLALQHYGTKGTWLVQPLSSWLELLCSELAAMALPLFSRARKGDPIP
ncbi:hypothetical protein KC340_g6176 [Hortaea werneckii]|nr:hypothetical protein KC342_g8685 [Hortaea werneckii]KAI7095914.1 hypothetical protein KC339_g10717 [Hortaea werneckii]KAI7227213.1 hypothetical protein KC365_g9024 [Hortaea werneckii]KAI7325100.1 hypothetical protein KC340_g6176 [Hortaea werneckii]KAI7401606.1 hypothetical protein KC328_g3132 [Hortaea werneckii]